MGKFGDRKNHYSIRKLSIGGASVLIGATIYLGGVNAQTVHAASVDGDATEQVEKNNEVNSETADVKNADQKQGDNREVTSAVIKADSAKAVDSTNDPANKSVEASNEEPDGPEEPEDPMDLAKKEAKILPQIAIKGEVPELDPKALMNGAYIYAHQISQSSIEEGSISAKWIENPDVSKVGTVTGKAEISYKTYDDDDDGNEVTKTLDIDVPLEVRNGEAKKAGQVRNTVNFVDNDSNQVVLSHSWIGKASDDEYSSPVPGFDSAGQLLENSIKLLGYKVHSDENFGSSANINQKLYRLGYFGKKDKTVNVLVEPTDAIKNDKYGVIYDSDDESKQESEVISPSDDPYGGPLNENNMDPANFIYGLGKLPEGAVVKWTTKPVLSERDSEGNYDTEDGLPALKNPKDIAIEIDDIKGKVVKTFKGDILNKLVKRAYSNSQDGAISVGRLDAVQGAELPNAVDAFAGIETRSGDPNTDVLVENSSELKNLLKNYNFTWVIAPDMQMPGYQYAYYTVTRKDADSTNYGSAFYATDENGDDNGESLADSMDGLTGSTVNRVLVRIAPLIKPDADNPAQKTVTRTITFTGVPADKADQYQDKLQTVEFTRADEDGYIGHQNASGDGIIYNNWHVVNSTAGSGSFESVATPVIKENDGSEYTATITDKFVSEVPAVKNVTATTQNSKITVKYVETKTPIKPDDKNPAQKTITRTIKVNYPEGISGDQPAPQEVKFNRKDAKGNVGYIITNADGTKTYQWNDWKAEGTNKWPAYSASTIHGYTPNITIDGNKVYSVAEVVVDPDKTKDSIVTVNYVPNTQTGKISYIDKDNNEVGKTTLTGKTGETVAIKPVAPKGWKIVPGQNLPKTEKVTTSGIPTVNVKVEHAKVVVPPTDPKTPKDKLPDNPDKHYPTGVAKDDLNKTVKRTITVIKPDGTKIDASQTVNLTRTATVDEVTGEVTYSDWTTGSFAEYDAPEVAGYTPSQAKVETVDLVKVDYVDPKIVITYSKNPDTGNPSTDPTTPDGKTPEDKTPDDTNKTPSEIETTPQVEDKSKPVVHKLAKRTISKPNYATSRMARVQKTATRKAVKKNSRTLPQTSAKHNIVAEVAGMLSLGLTTLVVGFEEINRKKNK